LTLVQEIVWDRRAQQNTTQRFSTRSERWLYLVKPGVLKGGRGRPKSIAPTFNLDDVRRPSTSADKRNNPAGANPADIWAFTQVHGTAKERTDHPCPFPQAMIERIVLACSNAGEVVLDPFGGSGTTGAAAIEHGRSAVMIEREPTYWQIIEKRLGLVGRHVVGKAETCVELFADFHSGDAIEKMKLIPSKSVNLILVDPPYGTTNCEWDQTLPAGAMWGEYKRILAPNGMIVIHAAQPFSIDLILSNRPWFRQQLIWKKNRPVGFLHSKRRHLVTDANVRILADAFRSFADIEKMARVVPVDEITANGGNLNVSRYVQTGADAESVDVAAEVAKLQDLIAQRDAAEAVMFEHLKRLGYVE